MVKLTVQRAIPTEETPAWEIRTRTTPKGVEITACNDDYDWLLVTVLNSGELLIHSVLPDDIGFSVDSAGRLNIVKG